MRSTIRVTAALMLVLLLTGCSTGGTGTFPGNVAPDLRGVVTSINWSGDTLRGAQIVWTDDPEVGPQAAYDAAAVSFTGDTAYYRKVGESYSTGSTSVIAVGSVVEVWFTGAVAESYPVQATASAIALVGSYEGTLPTPPGLQP